MATRQLDQLQLAIDVAKRNEDQAATRLYGIRRKLEEEEKLLEKLLRYQQEYQEKALTDFPQAIQSSLYHNKQEFIKNLVTAIDRQHQQIAKCKVMLDQQTQHWYSLKSRTEALAALIQEIQQKILQQEDKRDQQLQDELIQHKRKSEDH